MSLAVPTPAPVRGAAHLTVDVDAAIEVIANGGEQSRRALFRALERLDPHELAGFRRRLVEILAADAHHRVDDEAHSGSWTRSWQLSALVVSAGADADARRLMDAHSDRRQEPNRWVRYWTLASAAPRPEHREWVMGRARAIAVDGEEELLVRALAWAILGERDGDARAIEAILWCLGRDDAAFPHPEHLPVPAAFAQGEATVAAGLRALRIVVLPEAFDAVRAAIDACPFAPHTFDAIWVMGKYRDATRAAEASHTLARFVVTHRRHREYLDMVAHALRAIGRLGIPQTELLLAELESTSAGVFVEAAQALERLLGAEKAVDRLVDLAVDSDERDARLGDALRCMRRPGVIDALDRNLRSGVNRREEAARRLLIELGGTVAMDRAQVRRQDLEVRRQVASELDVRQRNHVKWIAFGDGAATWISVGMWVAVFGVGFVAVVLGIVLVYRQGFDTYAGWALAGSGGLFSVLGKLGFNGQMVEIAGARAAARLAIFTGYQRRLQHIDLLLSQRFIDGSALSLAELERLGELVSAAQDDVQRSLLTLIPRVEGGGSVAGSVAGAGERGGGERGA